MPVALATPMDAPHGPTSAVSSARAHFNKRPLWQKTVFVAMIIVGFLFSGFAVVRTFVQGCGCPDGFSYSNGADSGGCHCSGDMFTCRWDCGGNVCFANGEPVSCGIGNSTGI